MYKPRSSSHSCPLSVRCVKLRKSRIKNLSHRLFHTQSPLCCSSHLCPTIITTSPGAICLFLVSREQGLQELHSFAASTLFKRRDPLRSADWRNMFLVEDQKGEKRKVGTSAARRVSSKARSGQMPGSVSGDPMMVTDSPSTANGATGSEKTRESISRLTDTSSRTPRTSERSSRRAPATVCPIQTPTRRVALPNMAGGGRRGLVPTVRSSLGAGNGIQRGSERAERAQDRTALHVGVCSVRQWPGDGESWIDRAGRGRGGVAERISQAAHLSIGCGPGSGDVEHSRDPAEMGTSANSGKIPDANARPCSFGGCAEHQQAGTHPPQSPPPSKGDRTGRPGTTDEQRAKDTESTRASTQEDGGQVHLMENEIDIHETDLAESMAIWGFGEDDEDHMSLQ